MFFSSGNDKELVMEGRKIKEKGRARILYSATSSAFVFALISVIVSAISEGEGDGVRLIIFQLVMGLFFLRVPIFLEKQAGLYIPGALVVSYTLFIFCSIFLGEVALMYYRFPPFDDILHGASAVLLSLFALSIPSLLTRDCHLSPLALGLFALSFTLLIGVLWEIYEFAFDGILGLNMQKFAYSEEAGQRLVALSGRAALSDTMTDLIIDTLGATLGSVTGAVIIKRCGELPRELRVYRPERQADEGGT